MRSQFLHGTVELLDPLTIGQNEKGLISREGIRPLRLASGKSRYLPVIRSLFRLQLPIHLPGIWGR